MTISDQGYMSLPFQIRFENALKESNILVKCKLLTDLIFESISTNIKEMQHRYVLLIEDIFGCNQFGTNNWRLRSLTKESTPKEFDSIFYLLCIDGPVFKLIRHLMSNDQTMHNRHEFSIGYLPLSLRNQFDNPQQQQQHHLFMDKMSSPSTLSLNSFEFFLFHFACYITRETVQSPPSSFNSSLLSSSGSNEDTINVLYYILLENYLEFFVPIIDHSNVMKSATISTSPTSNNNMMMMTNSNLFDMKSSSLWKSLSSTTTNLLNLSSINGLHRHDGQPLAGRSMNQNVGGGEQRNDFYFGSNKSQQQRQQGSSILNPAIFNQFQQQQQNVMLNNNQGTMMMMINDQNDPIGNVSYKCDIVIRIFSEIWLSNSFTISRGGANAFSIDQRSSPSSSLRMIPAGHFNITIEHMRVVRIFIKHLHYFSNSSIMKNKYNDYSIISSGDQINSGGFISGSLNASLDDLKRSLWTSKYMIQKNLYSFLRIVFDRWPNDSSFRIPLETWLSYIQPWRYIPGHNSNETLNNLDRYDWRRFIDENIVFYTVLFRQVITRITKQLDLCSANNSLLLYRVLKVFGQDNLKEMMKKSEMKFFNNNGDLSTNLTTTPTTGGYVRQASPLFSHHHHHHQSQSSPYHHHRIHNDKNITLMDSEIVQSDYISIFSSGFRDQIIELLLKIAKSLHTVTELQTKSSSLSSSTTNKNRNKSEIGIFESIVNFFTIDYAVHHQSNKPNSNVNYEKIRNHLNASIEFVSSIFDIPQQSIETILANARKSIINDQDDDNNVDEMIINNHDHSHHHRKEDIYEMIDGVPKLTAYGLSQIMNGSLKLEKLPKIVEGNPDEQPVRSFEIGLLVRLTLFLSTLINRKFGQIFQTYYDQPNLYGAFCRTILSPPVSYAYYERSLSTTTDHNLGHRKPAIKINQLPPRINLRFMSSYGFLLQSFLFIGFLWLSRCLNCVGIYMMIIFITIFINLLCKVL
mgnify:CR=1 FL=1